MEDTGGSDTNSSTFLAIYLEEFSIYRPHKRIKHGNWERSEEWPLANELVSLHEINERNANFFYFDGLICFGDHRRYVRRIPFSLLSIGGYEALEQTTVSSDIWIQSSEGQSRDIWYCLRTPAPEYKRYHKPFLWLADFAKHVVDYLHVHPDVPFGNFRKRFYVWLKKLHGSHDDFGTVAQGVPLQ